MIVVIDRNTEVMRVFHNHTDMILSIILDCQSTYFISCSVVFLTICI